MGLTTLTPTTISCAGVRAAARKNIATKKTVTHPRRFMLRILFSRMIAKA
jgi:hypothetical protein